MSKEPSLSVFFRGKPVQVTFPSLSREIAKKTLESEPFCKWLQQCCATGLEIESIELQSVDMFGPRVGFVKLKSVAKMRNDKSDAPLPGICFLRGNSVAILVALVCEDTKVYSLLVEQPRSVKRAWLIKCIHVHRSTSCVFIVINLRNDKVSR